MNGFTVIELVMVLILLGVISLFVAPQLNSRDFEVRGFHDETLALMRYAQKTAIAQRRTVCVTFGPGSATLTIVAAAGSSVCPGGSFAGPRGEIPATVSARSGVAYVVQPGDFSFDGLGQPSAARTFEVAGDGTPLGRTITVEATTGYVHD
ncbi:MAG: GspH/FimT family protein [Hylemonella sp.]|nr:GspH/FimT family protein [Hylemonella sp.]